MVEVAALVLAKVQGEIEVRLEEGVSWAEVAALVLAKVQGEVRPEEGVSWVGATAGNALPRSEGSRNNSTCYRSKRWTSCHQITDEVALYLGEKVLWMFFRVGHSAVCVRDQQK